MNTGTSRETILVTDIGYFYRVTNKEGENRYYPSGTGEQRAEAAKFDKNNDTVLLQGFAVYDTAISTVYAIALCGDKEEAEKHGATKAPKTPTPTSATEDDPEETTIPHSTKPRGKRPFGKSRG